jgi:electron transfer flavoprotein beta subunit
MVAEILGVPLVGSIASLGVDGRTVVVERDTEDGRQRIEAPMPVMLLTQVGLNEPRYPSLKGIMAAKKKPVEQAPAPSTTGAKRLLWGEPFTQERPATGTILQDVPAADAAARLVDWLRERKLV